MQCFTVGRPMQTGSRVPAQAENRKRMGISRKFHRASRFGKSSNIYVEQFGESDPFVVGTDGKLGRITRGKVGALVPSMEIHAFVCFFIAFTGEEIYRSLSALNTGLLP